MATDLKQTADQETERTRAGQCYCPHVDILEKQDELLLLADMPGATAETLDIHFEDGVLSLHAAVPSRYPEDGSFMLCEYGVGDFYRTFRVGEHIDAGKIHAEVSDGVVHIHLPKAEQAKPRKIEVRAAS